MQSFFLIPGIHLIGFAIAAHRGTVCVRHSCIRLGQTGDVIPRVPRYSVMISGHIFPRSESSRKKLVHCRAVSVLSGLGYYNYRLPLSPSSSSIVFSDGGRACCSLDATLSASANARSMLPRDSLARFSSLQPRRTSSAIKFG